MDLLFRCDRGAADPAIGLRDDLWLDMAGTFITDKAKIRERISRPDYGYLKIEATVDDPRLRRNRGPSR